MRPKWLVDITALGLDYLRQDKDFVMVGAGTTFAQILDSGMVSRKILVLAEAAASVGSVQIRNLATIGGNLCAAVPSADSAPALVVLESKALVMGVDGPRSLALMDLFAGPKKTVLKQTELLTEVQVPLPPPGTGACFLKAGRRRAMSLAVVNAAVSVRRAPDGVTVEDVRIALGAVAPTPVRAVHAEQALRGQPFSSELVEEAASAVAGDIAPISDIRATAEHRRDLSRVLVQRALHKAWERADLWGERADGR